MRLIYNNSYINDWNFGASNVIKVYRNNAVVFYKFDSETQEFKICYAVVDDITQYQETEFEDVYDKATEKWYKLNNLNQYEEYGVYGSGRNITTYNGKLTVDDGYEYEWNGSSWVNVGEVSGSTASLPDVPFTLNYNAKNYDASTHSIPMTTGQLNDTDAVAYNNPNNIVDHSADGYITISNSSMRIRKQGQDISLFNRSSNSTSSDLTIVCKAKSTSGESIITNRDNNYNWMYRLKTGGTLRFHGTSETGSISWNTSNPDIMSVRTYYDSGTKLKYNNWTQNTSTTPISFTYGSTNTDSSAAGALFVGYSWSNTNEQWSGDFYWVYMAQANLTDEQVQQVIDYNEDGGGQTEYPKYYSEKSEPLDNLTFNTLEDAVSYAYNNCVYDGLKATIAGDRYYFDSEDENGWVKILSYYKVEDVTPGGASGWTISGSDTYNPDSSYYDDFDLVTTSTSNVTKIAKVTIYGYDHFTYYLRSYHGYYSQYAYVMATNVDEVSTPPSSMSCGSASEITNTWFWNKSPKSVVNLSNYRRVTYNNLDKTVEHTFYVYFNGRSYSSYAGNATILIPKEQTNENWEQVTFSASSNVAINQKNLYIDGNNSTSGGTQYWYHRWMVGLPSGSHTSYTNYSSYNYCPNVTSSTFTSVAGEQRQVNFTYDNTTNKSLQFRLVDTSGNTLSPSNTVYYNMTYYNSCGLSMSYSNVTFPRSLSVKVGGRFRFANSSNRHYIYGYSPNISLNTNYYVDNYQNTFDITYTKLSEEAVTITYTTYDPNDSETPAFKTDITWPYSGGTTSSTTLTSYAVPYTYPYEVSQTSNMFSAASQTFTAGQASRTITFTLYPNNRTFASVTDLEAYQYAWEGMRASVNGTNYTYKNGQWIEQSYTQYEYIRTQNAATIYYDFITNFKPTKSHTIEVKVEFVDRSIDWGHLVSWYDGTASHGFSFQTVTTSYQAIVRTGGDNGISYRPTIGANNPTVYTLPMAAERGTYSVNGGSSQTIQYNYTYMSLPANTGMCFFGRGTTSREKAAVAKMYYVKVYDNNNNLVKHYVPSDYNGTPCFYEIIDGEYIMDTYTGSNHGTLTLGPQV